MGGIRVCFAFEQHSADEAVRFNFNGQAEFNQI